MISRDLLELRCRLKSKCLRAEQSRIRLGVFRCFVLSEAEGGPSRAEIGLCVDNLPESRGGLDVLIRSGIEGSEIPPALDPVRVKSEGFLVEIDCFSTAILLASGARPAGQVFEGVVGRFGALT